MKDIGNQIQIMMSELYDRLDRLSDETLESLWTTLEPLYNDVRMLRAIEEAQKAFHPGDTLTRDEAIDYLLYM